MRGALLLILALAAAGSASAFTWEACDADKVPFIPDAVALDPDPPIIGGSVVFNIKGNAGERGQQRRASTRRMASCACRDVCAHVHARARCMRSMRRPGVRPRPLVRVPKAAQGPIKSMHACTRRRYAPRARAPPHKRSA